MIAFGWNAWPDMVEYAPGFGLGVLDIIDSQIMLKIMAFSSAAVFCAPVSQDAQRGN
jgi:hypothetical protein